MLHLRFVLTINCKLWLSIFNGFMDSGTRSNLSLSLVMYNFNEYNTLESYIHSFDNNYTYKWHIWGEKITSLSSVNSYWLHNPLAKYAPIISVVNNRCSNELLCNDTNAYMHVVMIHVQVLSLDAHESFWYWTLVRLSDLLCVRLCFRVFNNYHFYQRCRAWTRTFSTGQTNIVKCHFF